MNKETAHVLPSRTKIIAVTLSHLNSAVRTIEHLHDTDMTDDDVWRYNAVLSAQAAVRGAWDEIREGLKEHD